MASSWGEVEEPNFVKLFDVNRTISTFNGTTCGREISFGNNDGGNCYRFCCQVLLMWNYRLFFDLLIIRDRACEKRYPSLLSEGEWHKVQRRSPLNSSRLTKREWIISHTESQIQLPYKGIGPSSQNWHQAKRIAINFTRWNGGNSSMPIPSGTCIPCQWGPVLLDDDDELRQGRIDHRQSSGQ